MSGGSFVSPAMRQKVRGWAVPIATALGRLGLTPNALTIIGFIGTFGAALAAAAQQWLLAGILVLAFGIFDLFDGALARATGRASKFGAFLDSTLDRTGENLVYVGIVAGVAAIDLGAYWVVASLAGLALAFASVVTYARAKAELVGLHGEVGLAPREIRLAILGVGLMVTGLVGIGRDGFFPSASAGQYWLSLALGLIAILSAVTILQRIVHVRNQLRNEH